MSLNIRTPDTLVILAARNYFQPLQKLLPSATWVISRPITSKPLGLMPQESAIGAFDVVVETFDIRGLAESSPLFESRSITGRCFPHTVSRSPLQLQSESSTG